MSQLGSTASSPFEAAAWDESSHASTIAPGGAPPHAAAPPPQPAPSRSSAPLFPPTAGQPLQPSQRPGSRDAAATTIDPHHGLPGQPPIDSPAPGGSQRPNSRGNIERLMVAVNEHRPGSQGSNRQGTSPGRNSPLGADAGLAPPWSPSAKHAPSQPSPLGSRSASPTAMGKRDGLELGTHGKQILAGCRSDAVWESGEVAWCRKCIAGSIISVVVSIVIAPESVFTDGSGGSPAVPTCLQSRAGQIHVFMPHISGSLQGNVKYMACMYGIGQPCQRISGVSTDGCYTLVDTLIVI
eukprot:scaffold43914_cov17-Tisochrysis_lutea.AAC.1